jgi:shikimate kinase/shikimate 5-dehydrogenase
MKLFAVTGNPILYSKSPILFNFAFKENNLNDHIYTRIAADSAKEALGLANELDISGFNITAPFKEDFFSLTTSKNADAASTGVVNTFIKTKTNEDSANNFLWKGYNTDTFGVLSALSKKIDISNPANLSAVILGNGGAARACKEALDSIQIPSRYIARTTRLNAIEFTSEDAKNLFSQASIVISTIPPDVTLPTGFYFHKDAVLLDATYRSESEVTKAAKNAMIQTASGLDWLIGQAIKNYSLFTDKNLSDQQIQSLDSLLQSKKTDSKGCFYLIGLMGSGKSSVLQELAALGYSTLDTDQEIEKAAHMSINEIFATQGEIYFRKLEENIIRSSHADFIACGGGAVLNEKNRVHMKNNGTSFWLWSSIDTLESRLSKSTDRPLLKGKPIKETLTELLKERFKRYAETSDIIIRSDIRSSRELAEKILYEISSTR